MNCPVDNTALTMSERQGIEIDYCPTCRGVWLDRGELDKIIERSTAAHQPRLASHEQQAPVSHHQAPSDTVSNPHYYKKKKRESFLGDLFDF